MAGPFAGFPRESTQFFADLARHNNREWFQAHKETYKRACRGPMQALAAEFEPLGPTRISRINRDMRFSRDGKPYKTYIAMGLGKNYVSLSAEGLYVGTGIYKPEPATLQRFRAAVFGRDGFTCRGCGFASTPERAEDALDAHHITDRNEMPNGGYVAENGITLCEVCHAKA